MQTMPSPASNRQSKVIRHSDGSKTIVTATSPDANGHCNHVSPSSINAKGAYLDVDEPERLPAMRGSPHVQAARIKSSSTPFKQTTAGRRRSSAKSFRSDDGQDE